MVPEHRRHDISYNIWELLKHHLPGREGAKGVAARDNRLFINAFFWILRIGSPWRGLPPDYGNWKNTHRRFCRTGTKGGNQDMGRTKGGSTQKYTWPWIRMVCRSERSLR